MFGNSRFCITAVVSCLLGIFVGSALERGSEIGLGLTATSAAESQRRDNAPTKESALAVAQASTPGNRVPGKAVAEERKGPLRIICFGAHPDDCEIKAGGTAAMWAARGHHVKFVSVTNGDIGHWREAGGPLARRRSAEVQQAAAIFGITTEVLDIHDGELMPTLENRRTIVRLIRDWNADIVMGPRTNDYHPDHRYTGVLVQDAAYMVAVPFFCPDTPPLERNPVFLYYPDRFQKPYPFQADVAVGIDDVVPRKLDALVGMESQFVEGGALGSADLIAGDRDQRRRVVRARFAERDQSTAQKYR